MKIKIQKRFYGLKAMLWREIQRVEDSKKQRLNNSTKNMKNVEDPETRKSEDSKNTKNVSITESMTKARSTKEIH